MLKIKFLIIDVDGTLTDGKIYMGEAGELFKVFDIKDGCGIKDILPQHGVHPIIITGRESKILAHRCAEMGVTDFYQGIRNKIGKLQEIINAKSISDNKTYTYSDCAYIGDDILDLQCMIPIKQAGGLTACPANAAEEVKAVCDFVSTHNGGDGAVRDFIEYLGKQLSLSSPIP